MLAWVGAGLFALDGTVNLLAAHFLLQPNRVAVHRPRGVEEISVPSRYGLVPSWATQNWRKSPVVFILVDGYGGSRQTFEPLLPEIDRAGWGAVALSMNGHDASPDDTVGFGSKESLTVVDALHWLHAKRKDHPTVVLLGLSMGGAACWLASQIDPSPDAIVTDSSFADFPSAMHDWFSVVPLSDIALAPAVWMDEAQAGIDPASIRPVDAARKWNGRPALVIRAGSDGLMSPHHAVELSRASGAPLWTVPNAKHALCFVEDMPGYMAHLHDVVQRARHSHLVARVANLPTNQG